MEKDLRNVGLNSYEYMLLCVLCVQPTYKHQLPKLISFCAFEMMLNSADEVSVLYKQSLFPLRKHILH